MQLSLVMIGRDASPVVGAALEAAAPAVDERVFVDTGSRDDTRAIAAAAGCRVFDFAWCDDFAAARNAAIAHARGAWILVIDTDEILQAPAAARAVIDQAIAAAPDAPGFLISQDNTLDSGAVVPNPVARLFRRDPRIRYRNPVHECVSEAILEHWPANPLALLDVHLAHRGYLAANAAGKHARNCAILERWVAAAPDHAFARFNLGATLRDLGRTAEALVHLDHAAHLLADPAARAHVAYGRRFLLVYHRVLLAEGHADRAAEIERDAAAWLASAAGG